MSTTISASSSVTSTATPPTVTPPVSTASLSFAQKLLSYLPTFSHSSETQLSERVSPSQENKTEHITVVSTKSLPGWQQLDTEGSIQFFEQETSGVVKSHYTQFTRIRPLDSRTIVEGEFYIVTASYYGARPWEGKLWCVGQSDTHWGLLTIENNFGGASKFYPMMNINEPGFPIMVPEYSKAGKDGYISVFETNIGLVGFSTWKPNGDKYERLFQQTGFEDVFFYDNKFAIGYRQDTKTFECWNLETRSLEYSLGKWVKDDQLFLYFRPLNNEKHILLANAGQFIYAFDLKEKSFLYCVTLKDPDGSIGAYHVGLVGNQYFYTREYSSGIVRLFDIQSGEQENVFKIGGAVDYTNTDDYPMAVQGNFIFGLAEENRHIICQIDASTGEVVKKFGPVEHIITGIYCAENRVIASCQCTKKDNKNFEEQIIIWHLDENKEPFVISGSKGETLYVQEIAGNKMALAIYEPQSNATAEIEARIPKMAKTYKHDEQPSQSYHNPFGMIFYDRLNMQIWDVQTGLQIGTIDERFTKSNYPCMTNYTEGRLVMDREKVVLIQNFEVK